MTPSGNPTSTGRAGLDLVRWVWRHPAVQGHRARAVGRCIGWQVLRRVTSRPTTITLVGGHRLEVHPGSTPATAALYVGLPDWEVQRFLLAYLREGDTFIDGGANVGLYTLLAAGVAGVRVIAFEPGRPAGDRLAAAIEHNALGERVELRPVALGATARTASFTVGLDTRDHLVELADPSAAGTTRDVPVRRLDDEIDDDALVALVKLDLEGGEVAALAGAERLLSAKLPALIVEANAPDDLAHMLEPIGYRPYRYDPCTRLLEPASWGPRRRNVLALADLAEARHRLAEHR